MTEHWAHQFVGREYVEGVYDCAALLEDVQQNIFHRNVDFPKERKSHVILSALTINQHKDAYLEPVSAEEAQDGDVVLMVSRGRLSHIGVLAEIDGIRYVLHNLKSSGNVALHRIRDLDKYALTLEGYYRAKVKEPQS
jgi:uncharacterized protein YijF (DUF1287 family)